MTAIIPAGDLETGPRLIVFHGSADTVHSSNSERVVVAKGGSGQTSRSVPAASGDTRGFGRLAVEREDGTHGVERCMIAGAPYAWLGGHPGGSHPDPRGPDASVAMVGFFLNGASAPSRAYPSSRARNGARLVTKG